MVNIEMEILENWIFGSQISKNFWTNRLLVRRAILEVNIEAFTPRLSRFNDIGSWLLLYSLIGSIKTCLVVLPNYMN